MNSSAGLRRQLLGHGYEPIPIIGKAPIYADWSKGAITEQRLGEIETAYPECRSTGIRTGRCVAADIDLTNAAHCMEIEMALAKILGETYLRRRGKKGALLCYRNETPISKITIGTREKRLVEILGQGQQFAAYGLHPDTGREYEWPNDYLGGEPAQLPLAELPEVTPAQLYEAAQAVAARLRQLGYGDVGISGIKAESVKAAPSAALGQPISSALIEDMLRCIPPSCDRHQWLTTCGGLLNAPVADPGWNGLDLFVRWSAGEFHGGPPANYQGPEDCEAQWSRDVEQGTAPAFGALVNLAREHGFSGPSHLPPSVPPAHERISPQTLDKLLADSEQREERPLTPRNKFAPIFASEFRSLPLPRYVVDLIVPDKSITLIYGPSGSFKSFLLQDILASTAVGKRAFNKFATVQGDTIMAAGEAPYGIAQKRVPAWALARGIEDLASFRFAIVPSVPLVSNADEVKAFVAALKAAKVTPRLIGVDTVARAMGGLDENEARAAGLMLVAAEHIITELGCAVILVAHTGKDEDNGPRGSSALFAGVDAVFRVTRAKDTLAVRLTCEKMKDADPPGEIHLQGKAVADSLIFTAIDADTFAALSRTNPPLAQADIQKSLREAGAIAGTKITTRQLAVSMLADCGSDGDPKAIQAMERRLRRGAEKQLAAYVAAGSGQGAALRWTFPTLENGREPHV